MALKRKDVLIRPNSTLNDADTISAVRGYINGLQNHSRNAKSGGGFNDDYFVDYFDARNSQLIRIYADACASKYNMPADNGLIKYIMIDPTNVPSGGGSSSQLFIV